MLQPPQNCDLTSVPKLSKTPPQGEVEGSGATYRTHHNAPYVTTRCYVCLVCGYLSSNQSGVIRHVDQVHGQFPVLATDTGLELTVEASPPPSSSSAESSMSSPSFGSTPSD